MFVQRRRRAIKRLDPSVFKIPSDKIRAGYYSDRYFVRSRDVLVADRRKVRVAYQYFPRQDAVVCGLDEAIAVLKTCAGHYRNNARAEKIYQQLRLIQWKLQQAGFRENHSSVIRWQNQRAQIRDELNHLWVGGWHELDVRALFDGASVRRDEPILVVRGDPRLFVYLETVVLGVIARPTSTATAVRRLVKAASGRAVLFFSGRFDHYWIQTTDGYAALKAGAFGVSTDANADYWGVRGMGTIPHALIGAYDGDTVAATMAFDRHVPADVNRIALVDWDNDCIGTTRNVIEAYIRLRTRAKKIDEALFLKHARRVVGTGRGRLWGIRMDTSASLKDRSVRRAGSNGVCPELVRRARKTFDRWGCNKLKIVVSGGFDEAKVRRFEALKLPVDAYGVGASLLKDRIDITADIVECRGKPCAKVGRRKGRWSRLTKVR